MSSIKALIAVLASLLLLVPGAAQVERFTDLEYGFSAEYPKELVVSVKPENVRGIDNPVATFTGQFMAITVSASERHGLSAEDIAAKAEGAYKEGVSRLEILSSKKREIDGKEALIKEYLIEQKNETVKIKDVYLKSDDLLYKITCGATESNYRKADIIYFENFIRSFKVIPVNDTMKDNIKGFPQRTVMPIWSSAALGDIVNGGQEVHRSGGMKVHRSINTCLLQSR